LPINGRDTVNINFNVMTFHFIVLAYAKGYNVKPNSSDPFYSISLTIDGFTEAYGVLAGAAFTIPISVVGIFMVNKGLFI
jgi:hypothetical protein